MFSRRRNRRRTRATRSELVIDFWLVIIALAVAAAIFLGADFLRARMGL